MKFAEQYSYNKDGSVRGEFASKEHGVIPLSFSAKMFGVNLMKKIRCKKADFRGMLFDLKHINDDGLACDSEGNPLEEERTYEPIPDVKPERWDHYIFISRDGESVLEEEEWAALKPEEQANYRKVGCIEVELASDMPINGPIYLCREATTVIAELLRLDVLIGDPINERYQHECRHNEEFAAQFSYVLDMALEELKQRQADQELLHAISMELADMIFGFISGDNDEEDESSESEQEKSEEQADQQDQGDNT